MQIRNYQNFKFHACGKHSFENCRSQTFLCHNEAFVRWVHKLGGSLSADLLLSTNRSIFSSKGHIKVPEELKFPNACCLGIASQTVLSIYNPSDRWLQVNIGILSVSINGEKVRAFFFLKLNNTVILPDIICKIKALFTDLWFFSPVL